MGAGFQKNLVVWKRGELEHVVINGHLVSEELSSVETMILLSNFHNSYKGFRRT